MAEIQHASGELRIPEGVGVVTGSPNGARRGIGVVVSRFNGDITTRLLEGALQTLTEAGVPPERIDVMPVPGAFELPLGAMALAKTRRYACIVALGCVIRGDTPHFEYVAGEAASGLQLAGLETGVPVSFGVLTCDSRRQAEERAGGPQGNKGSRTFGPQPLHKRWLYWPSLCRRSAQSAGKLPRSETTGATRWWQRSGGSTRTSSASAFS